MPLGSSSAAPVMRPGPNCLTLGFSAMLFSNLTIAALEKRPGPASVIGWNSKDHWARTESGRAIAPSAFCRTALPMTEALSGRCEGAAHAALTATDTTTHEDDLCD